MSFEKLEKHLRSSNILAKTVRAYKVGTNGQVRFAISRDIAEEIGLEVGARADVFVGTGLDAGKIAVAKASNGSGYSIFPASKTSKSVSLTISAARANIPRPEKASSVAWHIDLNSKALILDCSAMSA